MESKEFKKVNLPEISMSRVSHQSIVPGHIPLVAMGNIEDEAGEISLKHFSLIQECGLNVFIRSLHDHNIIRKYLESAEKTGVKVIAGYGFRAPNISKFSYNPPTEEAMLTLQEIVPQYPGWVSKIMTWKIQLEKLFEYCENRVLAGNPNLLDNFAGFLLQDEPKASQMWRLVYQGNEFEKKFISHGIGQMPIFTSTLLPDLTTGVSSKNAIKACDLYSGGLNTAINYLTGYSKINNYNDYVNLYDSMFNPPFIAFDAYPFREDKNQQKSSMRSFFNSLIYFQSRKAENGKDFWSTVLTQEITDKLGNHYSAPTIGRIRFGAFISLLYGATGLQFFRFFQEEDNNDESYNAAPVNSYGIKTQTFNYLKTVVQQIKKIEGIILSTKSALTAVTKAPPLADLTEIPGIKKMGKYNFGVIKKISEETSGFILSHMYNSKYNYIFVVSMNEVKVQTSRFEFQQIEDVEIYENIGSILDEGWCPVSDQSIKNGRYISFAPSDMVIFRYPR